jgi:hypothetical protein
LNRNNTQNIYIHQRILRSIGVVCLCVGGCWILDVSCLEEPRRYYRLPVPVLRYYYRYYSSDIRVHTRRDPSRPLDGRSRSTAAVNVRKESVVVPVDSISQLFFSSSKSSASTTSAEKNISIHISLALNNEVQNYVRLSQKYTRTHHHKHH